MNVLMTADAVGGVWTYACELIAGVAAHDVDVHLAVLGPPPSDSQAAEAETAGCAALHCNGAALEWMPDPWEELDAAEEWLVDLAADVVADVVHLNSYVHAAARWRRPVVCVGHSCVLSWWAAVRGDVPPPSWDRYRARVGRGLHAADEVVAPSGWMLGELRRIYGIARGRVIHNGLGPRSSPPEPGRDRLIMTAGRLWDPAKNLDAVVAIAPELRWPVAVAGGDPGETGNVVSLGRLARTDLLARLQGAGMFVLPARYEPFGFGPLEAARAGCPLILGDIPSLRELWDGAALFVHPDDPRALLHTCNALITDDEERARWSRRARARASRYSRSAMSAGYAELYADVLHRARATAGAGS